MGYLSDWIEAEEHAAEVQARFPDCRGGTVDSLRCTAFEHMVNCNRRRFDLGYGIWCRQDAEGRCVRTRGHEGPHIPLALTR